MATRAHSSHGYCLLTHIVTHASKNDFKKKEAYMTFCHKHARYQCGLAARTKRIKKPALKKSLRRVPICVCSDSLAPQKITSFEVAFFL